jgi:hypothetical protein
LSDLEQNLVPGRSCGGCTVCCKHLTIKVPELKKLPGYLCVHCTEGAGCQIYETRPPVCRNWYCGWRFMPQLDDSWRPDLSEILIRFQFEDIPPGYTGPALNLELIGSLQKILWLPLVEIIGGALENRLPVFLSIPGTPGHVSGKLFLNDNMAVAYASGQLVQVMNELVRAVEAGVKHPKEAINLDED